MVELGGLEDEEDGIEEEEFQSNKDKVGFPFGLVYLFNACDL